MQVDWDGADYDNENMFADSGNAGWIIIKKSGVYDVVTQVDWESNEFGIRLTEVQRSTNSGGSFSTYSNKDVRNTSLELQTAQSTSGTIELDSGDLLRMVVYHTGNVDLTIDDTLTPY